MSDDVVEGAIEALNGSAHYEGAKYPLKVARAERKDKDKDTRGGGGGGGEKRKRDDDDDRGGVPPGKCATKLFVAGMSPDAHEELMKDVDCLDEISLKSMILHNFSIQFPTSQELWGRSWHCGRKTARSCAR